MLAAMLVLYPLMVVWSAFAVGPVDGPAIMLPVTVIAGVWIWIRVRRRIARAEAALADDTLLMPVCVEQLDRAIQAKRLLRWSAPALVTFTLGSAAIVVGRHGNTIYWTGGISVGVFLLLGAIRAHVSLRKDLTLRASLG